MRDRYFFRDGAWRTREGVPMPLPPGNEPCAPLYVVSDIADYRSPIDGRPVSSRSTRRDDLKRHGCVEAEPRKPRGYKNPKFAGPRGLAIQES